MSEKHTTQQQNVPQDQPNRAVQPAGTDAAQRVEQLGQGDPAKPQKTVRESAAGERGRAKAKPAKNSPSIEDAAKPQNRGLFRSVVALYGLLIVVYAAWQVVSGTGSAPESAGAMVTPSIESNYVFLAATYLGVGLAFIFIAWKFKWANMLVLACLVVFLGGVGRIIAWATFGTPHWSLIVLMVTDLVIPPCLLVWYGWINKSNKIRQQMLSASRA